MILSRYTLKNILSDHVVVPDEALFDLPEKVLQFGTGVFLRGLPDYFIDKANRQGVFNGRIVVVESDLKGDTAAFKKQDSLYTLCVRDQVNGEKVEENIINSSISRVLDAQTEWKQVLDCAHNSNIQIIVSYTTEVGIKLVQEDILRHPPASFPGKLLAFLYERFLAFGGSERSGLVIVPTELISNNSHRLESIVLELAHLNGLEDNFIEWLENHNHFCNSIVDRIVPGHPEAGERERLEVALGYTDRLITVSEAYKLWAIEGDEKVKACLSFAQADENVVITSNIDLYRELKLRLLNGTHTLCSGLAFLSGFDSVSEAMGDEAFSSIIEKLMLDELAMAIPYPANHQDIFAFGEKTLERFRNPYIQHRWINITAQYSSKMKMRCTPALLHYYQQQETVPEVFALGFAAYLYFMKAIKQLDGQFYGEWNGIAYQIQDDQAEVFCKRWNSLSVEELVGEVLRDKAYWGAELNRLPGFQEAVTEKLNTIVHHGAREAINAVYSKKEVTV
ncbi:MAG TPA: tagaturonate reductase [Chitinophagaceae bacterium]